MSPVFVGVSSPADDVLYSLMLQQKIVHTWMSNLFAADVNSGQNSAERTSTEQQLGIYVFWCVLDHTAVVCEELSSVAPTKSAQYSVLSSVIYRIFVLVNIDRLIKGVSSVFFYNMFL